MGNYIFELFKNCKMGKLEGEIETNYPQIKASVTMKPSLRELRLVIADKNFHFIKAYEITEFDCKSVEQSCLPDGLDKLPKSQFGFDDESIWEFYIKFMKKEFATYYDDYKQHLMKAVDKDLNCEHSV